MATMQATQDSHGVSQLLSVLEHLVKEQVKHVQIISKQEEHLAAIRNQRQIQLQLDPTYTEFQESSERKREIRGQWHDEILKWNPLGDWLPDENRHLDDIFSIKEPPELWTTWQYQAAYPNTAKFLAKATSAEKSRSVVYYDSFFQTGEKVEQWSSEDPYGTRTGKKMTMPERMWDIVKRRMVVDRPGQSGNVRERLPSRLLRIVDISPVIATILLASTPKYNTPSVLI
jgi:hypothetical protein